MLTYERLNDSCVYLQRLRLLWNFEKLALLLNFRIQAGSGISAIFHARILSFEKLVLLVHVLGQSISPDAAPLMPPLPKLRECPSRRIKRYAYLRDPVPPTVCFIQTPEMQERYRCSGSSRINKHPSNVPTSALDDKILWDMIGKHEAEWNVNIWRIIRGWDRDTKPRS
jgi:hypothetical protein